MAMSDIAGRKKIWKAHGFLPVSLKNKISDRETLTRPYYPRQAGKAGRCRITGLYSGQQNEDLLMIILGETKRVLHVRVIGT